MEAWIIVFLFLSIACQAVLSDTSEAVTSNQIKLLRDKLFNASHYDRSLSPTKDHQKKLEVKIQMHYDNLLYVIPSMHYVGINVIICRWWQDHRLTWNPSEYDGLNKMYIDGQYLWIPIMEVLTTIYGFTTGRTSHTLIYSNGTVKDCSFNLLRENCQIDLTNFPNDQQSCKTLITAYGRVIRDFFPSGSVSVNTNNINPEWVLTSASVETVTSDLPGTGAVQAEAFTLNFKRRSSEYYYTVGLPGAVVTLLTLMIFWMPPSSDIKITIGCVNFLIIGLLLIHAAVFLKGSVSVPKVISFLGGSMITEAFAMVMAVVVLNVSRNQPLFRPPAPVMKYITIDTVKKVLYIRTLQDKAEDSSGLLEDGLQNTTPQDSVSKQEWYVFAQFIDRIMFLIFAIALAAKHA